MKAIARQREVNSSRQPEWHIHIIHITCLLLPLPEALIEKSVVEIFFVRDKECGRGTKGTLRFCCFCFANGTRREKECDLPSASSLQFHSYDCQSGRGEMSEPVFSCVSGGSSDPSIRSH